MGPDEIERIKLEAGFLNSIAVAMVVAGTVAPLVAASLGVGQAHGAWLLLPVAGWLVGGVVLHQLAKRRLRRLRT